MRHSKDTIMRWPLAVTSAFVIVSPAFAGDPVTVTNAANTQQAIVDGSGLHVVCDSGCSGGGGGGGNVTITGPLGSTTSSASVPVVIASDQAAVAVKAAATTFATGSIVDIGTATSPAAGTVNAQLATIVSNTGSAVTGYAQGSTTSGQVGPLQQAAVTTAAPAYTTGKTSPQSLDLNGGTRTLIQDSSGVPVSYTSTVPTGNIGPYPGTNVSGTFTPATPITCSSGNVANGTVACTLAAAASKITYLQGWIMSSDGATATLGVGCTITGTITGTMNFAYTYEAATIPSFPIVASAGVAISGSTTNTAIVLSCPASGAGGAHASMTAWGYQQ